MANREDANIRGVNVHIMELTKEEQDHWEEILNDKELLRVFINFSENEEMSSNHFLKIFKDSK